MACLGFAPYQKGRNKDEGIGLFSLAFFASFAVEKRFLGLFVADLDDLQLALAAGGVDQGHVAFHLTDEGAGDG